jgi:hypothetical protein
VTEASELLCKLPRRCRYRCHQHNALTAFPPFFLLLSPVQSVLALGPRGISKPRTRAMRTRSSPISSKRTRLSGSIGKMGESLQTRVRD